MNNVILLRLEESSSLSLPTLSQARNDPTLNAELWLAHHPHSKIFRARIQSNRDFATEHRNKPPSLVHYHRKDEKSRYFAERVGISKRFLI